MVGLDTMEDSNRVHFSMEEIAMQQLEEIDDILVELSGLDDTHTQAPKDGGEEGNPTSGDFESVSSDTGSRSGDRLLEPGYDSDDDDNSLGLTVLQGELKLVGANTTGKESDEEMAKSFQTPTIPASSSEAGSSNDDDTIGDLDFRLAVDDDSSEKQPDGLGVATGSAVVINYLSVGYVLLPWGFSQGGILLSSVVLAFVALQSYCTSLFLLDACARAKLVDRKFNQRLANTYRGGSSLGGSWRASLRSSLSLHGNGVMSKIQNESVELSELCRIFLGPTVRNFFTVTAAFDLYGITWTFAAVFASSLAEQRPIGTAIMSDYKFYMLVFAAITVPLSCIPILDQLVLQMLFLAARTIMVFLMIGTLAGGYANSDVPTFGDQAGPTNDVPLADFRNIVTIFQVAVFSTAFQFAVPGLAEQCKNKLSGPKKIFRIGVSYTFVTNLVLAIMASVFFVRSATAESSNLNWINYHGSTWNYPEDSVESSRASWASFISSYVILFAAIDGLAVFPLVALSLGDILMGAVFGEDAKQQSWKVTILFRFAGSVPQLVGAMFVSELGVISKYAGVFTLLSYTTCPALLHLKSRNIMPRLAFFIPKHSRIKMWLMAWFLVGFSLLLIIGVVADTILSSS